MGVSNGTTALGIAVALGEISMPKAEQICKDLSLYSSVASCSSGVELDAAQIVLLGNKAGAGGRYRIGHSVMKDALDIDGIYTAITKAAVGGVAAAAIGDPAVFVSVDAMHQGPQGGGPVIAIVDVGE